MSELLPCPWCGEAPTIATYNSPNNWEVTCGSGKCTVHPSTKTNYLGARGYDTREEATAAWNTRTPDPETVKVLEEVVKQFETDPVLGHAAYKMKVLATAELKRLKGA